MTASQDAIKRVFDRVAADTESAEAPITPVDIEQSVSWIEQEIRDAAPEARLNLLRVRGREVFASWPPRDVDRQISTLVDKLSSCDADHFLEDALYEIADEIAGRTAAPIQDASEVDEDDGDRKGEPHNETRPQIDLQNMILPPLTASEWMARDLPPVDFLLGSMLSTTNRMLLAADTGIGKTNLAIAMGMRIAAGAPFLHWSGSGKPRRVLYIDGEMSRKLLQQRVVGEEQRFGVNSRTFFALSHDDIPNFQPLNTPEGQAWIKAFIAKIGGVDLVIFDNIQSLIVGSMVDEISWAQTMRFIRSLTKQNVGQIWVHHTGQNGQSYGTKTREWQLDTMVMLKQIKRLDTDVSFKLSFQKARERAPSNRHDFQDVEIALVDDAWVYTAAEPSVDASERKSVSPTASKFLEALKQAVAAGGGTTVDNQAWMTACGQAGLVDLKGERNTVRAQLSKYRRQLKDAGLVGTEADRSWLIA